MRVSVVENLFALLGCAMARQVLFVSPRPNPSVKRTVNGGPRSAVSGEAVPPLSAAYLQRLGHETSALAGDWRQDVVTIDLVRDTYFRRSTDLEPHRGARNEDLPRRRTSLAH